MRLEFILKYLDFCQHMLATWGLMNAKGIIFTMGIAIAFVVKRATMAVTITEYVFGF
jgi:hypothetical protein